MRQAIPERRPPSFPPVPQPWEGNRGQGQPPPRSRREMPPQPPGQAQYHQRVATDPVQQPQGVPPPAGIPQGNWPGHGRRIGEAEIPYRDPSPYDPFRGAPLHRRGSRERMLPPHAYLPDPYAPQSRPYPPFRGPPHEGYMFDLLEMMPPPPQDGFFHPYGVPPPFFQMPEPPERQYEVVVLNDLALRDGPGQNRRPQGVEPEVPAAQEESAERATEGNDQETCKICYENRITTAFVPCGHMAACLPCAKNTIRTTGKCPICKARHAAVLKLYKI